MLVRPIIKNSEVVILQVSNGKVRRTWHAKLTYENFDTNTRKLHGGWLKFVRENNLEEHDVCVFILIEEIGGSIEVVIFQNKDVANCTFSSILADISDNDHDDKEDDEVDDDYEEDEYDDDYEPEADSEDEDESNSDDSIEILYEFPPCLKAKTMGKSSLASGLQKRKRNSSKTHGKSNIRRAGDFSSTRKIYERKPKVLRQMSGNIEFIALERACNFKSKSVNPSFWIAISPSHVKISWVVRFLK